MSYLNLKSRPSVEVSTNPSNSYAFTPSASAANGGAAAGYSPIPTARASTTTTLVSHGYATPMAVPTSQHQPRNFSPPREHTGPNATRYQSSGPSAAIVAAAAPAATTTVVTTTIPSQAETTTHTVPAANNANQNLSAVVADPSAYAPAATLLRVELDHVKAMLERQTDLTQRLEKERRGLADQLELSRREARDAKDIGNAEWRKRLMKATDDNEKLRSDMAALHEEVATMRAQLAEAQRTERRAEGLQTKLHDTEDNLHRHEVMINELRKAKALLEREIEDMRRNNPAAMLNSQIVQLNNDIDAREAELRRKQEEITSLTRQLQDALGVVADGEDRLKAESRRVAQQVVEIQELSKRLLDNDKQWLDREVELKRKIDDLERSLKSANERCEEALHGRDMAEQTLGNVQRDHKRHLQGTELHLAQRGAEIESLNKQLDVYKSKLTEINREMQEMEVRASGDRKIRDGVESELSRERIINEDLRMQVDRLSREHARLEKDNDLIYQQLNVISEKASTLADQKLTLEKMLETANVKIELGNRNAIDLENCEKALMEKRVQITEIESRVRTLEPFTTRCEQLETMNEALKTECQANRNEITVLRLTLEEERDSHARTSNKVRIMEARLSQSDDRHDEMMTKLKTLELLQQGDRASQLAGTFEALHDKINSTDADNLKILEVNAALMKELKDCQRDYTDLEKQVARAREITREAEMAKVEAQIARDDALQRLATKEKELEVSTTQYASYAPNRIDAERRSHLETIESLQKHLKDEKAYSASLKQKVDAHEDLSKIVAAEKDLNRQLQYEMGVVGSSVGGQYLSPSRGLGGQQSSPVRDSPVAVTATTTKPDKDAESIITSTIQGNASPAPTHRPAADATSSAAAGPSSRTLSPPRAAHSAPPPNDNAMRTLEPSPFNMNTSANAHPSFVVDHRDGLVNITSHRDGRLSPSRNGAFDGSGIANAFVGMKEELNDLRRRNDETQSARESRIDALSEHLAEAIREMKQLRDQREHTSKAPGGARPMSPTSRNLNRTGDGLADTKLGRLGSGAVAAPHRALNSSTSVRVQSTTTSRGGGLTSNDSPSRRLIRDAASPNGDRYYQDAQPDRLPDSPYTSPYRSVGGGGVVMVTSPRTTFPATSTRRPANTTRTTTVTVTSPSSTLTAPTAASRAKTLTSGNNNSVGGSRAAANMSGTRTAAHRSSGTVAAVTRPTAAATARSASSNFDINNSRTGQTGGSRRNSTAASTADATEDSLIIIDPSTLDDDELLRELEAAKKRMKKVLLKDRMAASPGQGAERARY